MNIEEWALQAIEDDLRGSLYVVPIRLNVLSISELKTLTIYIINANILIKYFGSDI